MYAACGCGAYAITYKVFHILTYHSSSCWPTLAHHDNLSLPPLGTCACSQTQAARSRWAAGLSLPQSVLVWALTDHHKHHCLCTPCHTCLNNIDIGYRFTRYAVCHSMSVRYMNILLLWFYFTWAKNIFHAYSTFGYCHCYLVKEGCRCKANMYSGILKLPTT